MVRIGGLRIAVDLIAEEIRAAVAQEREACAKECDRIAAEFKARLGLVSLSQLSADACAAAIRARQ